MFDRAHHLPELMLACMRAPKWRSQIWTEVAYSSSSPKAASATLFNAIAHAWVDKRRRSVPPITSYGSDLVQYNSVICRGTMGLEP